MQKIHSKNVNYSQFLCSVPVGGFISTLPAPTSFQLVLKTVPPENT